MGFALLTCDEDSDGNKNPCWMESDCGRSQGSVAHLGECAVVSSLLSKIKEKRYKSGSWLTLPLRDIDAVNIY